MGNGLDLAKSEILSYKKIQLEFISKKFWQPKAQDLISLASQRLAKHQGDAVDQLVPLYLYPEDCQVDRR